MEIKAIFFDIDGTLVNMKDRKVPESTNKALNDLREKGIKLFICSGRHPTFRKTLDEEVNFTFDGYIYVNGQCITDKDGNIIYKKTLDKKTREDAYKFLNENKDLSLVVMEENRMYSKQGKDELIVKHDEDDIEKILDNEVYQFVIMGKKELDERIINAVPGLKSARWSLAFADFIPKDGGKDKGVLKMLELFNIDVKNTMAFGDGGNDIPMLETVNISVAMGNALDDVKNVVTYITSDVDKDGIYNALKKYEVL